MLGHESIPSESGELLMPATVVASHLKTCAAELAASAEAGHSLGNAEDFAEIAGHLLAGQQAIARVLTGMAGRIRVGANNGTLAAVPTLEVEVLGEILQAAGKAVGYSAEALAESGPSFESLVESSSADTRL